MTKLIPGMRIAYTRDFAKMFGNNCDVAQRRGTYLGPMSPDGSLVRVRWDDIDEAAYAAMAKQYGQDYADDARENGCVVAACNICGTKHKGFVELETMKEKPLI